MIRGILPADGTEKDNREQSVNGRGFTLCNYRVLRNGQVRGRGVSLVLVTTVFRDRGRSHRALSDRAHDIGNKRIDRLPTAQ